MVALLLTVAAVGGLVIVADATGADSAGFVITVTLMGFSLALFVGESLERRIPGYQWDRISFSRDANRRWGVHLFNAVLSWVGWNRLIIAMREDQAAGRGKDRSPRPMRAAAAGHAWAFLLHIAAAVWAGMIGDLVTPLVILAVGIVGHLYPVLLQIRILTRLREVQGRHQYPSIG
ncbi:hypothetical protein [Corynebacterium ulcerans]|uniref:Glycosyl-4,4'-diaponeurosporenoate acyltransferase n=1 Tax=Corynebacterium ulcerans TaxID=65058 RepID=A0ABD0BFT2_CORUL|nr:hypothetical protein [Corynebacterium ulcerans]KPH77725.1 hypothetical protein AFK72_03225 [Corynebacterium ulcerans]OIS05153.1 hypothetical protein BHG00_08900 [Corynebacterium ulcerans]BAM26914.1 putative membrane protein [Corynebacterium ulcerans 0102]BBJ71574.1 hypothetical protein CULC0211_07080 [Corynebacterium ulcerans]BBJ73879.1 hypothetical protein CULCFH20161_07060 [Corynebacterium ulcerans]